MRLRPNVALQQTGRLLMKRASRALLLIALQLNLGVRRQHTGGKNMQMVASYHRLQVASLAGAASVAHRLGCDAAPWDNPKSRTSDRRRTLPVHVRRVPAG